jgi:hypothetical protein
LSVTFYDFENVFQEDNGKGYLDIYLKWATLIA